MRDSFVDPNDSALPGADLAAKLADYVFNVSKPRHIFDDLYHFSARHYARHANNRNLLPVAKLMFTAIAEKMIDQNFKLAMIPEAITQGVEFQDVAKKHQVKIRKARNGILSTYRLQELLQPDQLNIFTEKNKNRSMQRLNSILSLRANDEHPIAALSPTALEAMLKTLAKESGFTNKVSLYDQDFEAFWMGICLLSQEGDWVDDVDDSRNGNFETFIQFLTQYGVVPVRPKGDTEIFTADGLEASPADYLSLLQSHLEKVTPRGFMADLTAKMAVRVMVLEEMRVKNRVHPDWPPLDPARFGPGLRKLDEAHDRRFDRLKDAVLAYMDKNDMRSALDDHFGLADYDRLSSYYERFLGEMKARRPNLAELTKVRKEEVATIRQRLDLNAALEKAGLQNSQVTKTPFQMDGNFFAAAPKLFDEKTFARCSEAEQIALKAFMGLIETPQPATDAQKQGEILLFIEPRGGKAAAKFAADVGILVPREARGVKAKFTQASFEKFVKTENARLNREAAARLRAAYPGQMVTTWANIERHGDNFAHNRRAIVARGPDKFSGTAKTALAEEVMRRRGSVAGFDPDWMHDEMPTMLRLQARKIQLGLLDRPDNVARHNIAVSDYNDDTAAPVLTEKSLADDIKAMTGYMRKLVKAKTEDYPRHVVKGLLELVTMADLYYHQPYNRNASENGDHDLIDWQSVPQGFLNGLEGPGKARLIGVIDEAKRLILDHGMTALAPEDVEGELQRIGLPQYAAALPMRQGDQMQAGAKTARGGLPVVQHGFNGARPQ